MAREWYRLKREKASLALLILDVDHFKLYNDTYGHSSGDKVLKSVATTLAHSLKRPTDVVARYGGEEFAIILPNTNVEGAQHVARHIADNVVRLGIHQASAASQPYLTISIGISCMVPGPQMSLQDLLRQADQALYVAKQQGRNRIVVSGDCP